jgi:hypothetical protein
VAKLFADASAAVVGLHTVFEHHDVMTLAATGLLLHEYRIRLPAGVDEPIEDDDPIARTMRAYALRGTPSTVLIDAEGRFRQQMFSATLASYSALPSACSSRRRARRFLDTVVSAKANGCNARTAVTTSRVRERYTRRISASTRRASVTAGRAFTRSA